MRVLVTGGAGYVGREVVRRLYNEHEVSVLDTVRHGYTPFTDKEASKFRHFGSDLRDAGAIKEVVDDVRPDIVIHLAAIHFIPECEAMPDEAIATNTIGTANLLRCCPTGTRLVFISTAAVYAPSEEPHSEESSPIGPADVYGLTKLHAEQFVSYWARERQLDATIVRMFNVIGPGETNPHILPAILAQVLQGQDTLRLGNVHPRRDYIDVRDAAAGIVRIAMTDRGSPRETDITNLGTGRAYSVVDLVEQLSAISGRPLRIETDPERVRQTDRPVLIADTRKAHRDYNWLAEFSLADSLTNLWQNPDIPKELLERS